MPFKSFKQQSFMFAKHPEIAKKWADKYGTKDKPDNYKSKPKSAWMNAKKKGE